MGGALEAESQACVTAQSLGTSEFTVLELCSDCSNRPIWALLSKQKCCPALQVTASPLVTAVHTLSQAMPTLPAAGPRLQAEQCLLKSKPANQGQLRERAGKTPAFPPPIKTSLHAIHPPALQ